MKKTIMAATACALPSAALAQGGVPVAADTIVPANTSIPFTLDEEVNSQTARVGQQFGVTVARDVVTASGGVIPRGTHGRGEVTWRSGKGAYGKSGKMEIQLRMLDIGGRTIALTGKYREEGEGKTGVTIATIAFGGLLAGALVNGKSAVFEQGREVQGFTAEAVALHPARAPAMVVRAAVVAPAFAAARTWAPASPARVYANYMPGETRADILQRRLAAAQPVRRGDAQQGWTITD